MANLIYERIMALIQEQNLSRSSVERKAGLGNGTIKTWERVSPSVDKVNEVAKVLGVPLSDLVKE